MPDPPSNQAGLTRLAILSSHPIQYFAPWYRHLANLFNLDVLYAYQQDAAGQGAAGFGMAFEWDIPLLEGYRYRWLKNVAREPGLQTFGGCDTPELYDLIRPENYDALLVLGWNKKSFIQGIRAARRNQVPVLMRGDSQLQTKRGAFKRALKYPFYRWFLPRIDAHLYVGTRNREYLRHYGVPEERLFFSPHFVDNEWFAARAAEVRGQRTEVRRKWGIPEDAFVALFAGKFIDKKRPADFVSASLVAAEKRKDFHAVLVGDGLLRADLEALAARHPAIHFAGFRNQMEMPSVYASADLLVLPSENETWGLVVNEAMACGVPVLVSDAVGCAPDMIEPGVTGFVFPAGDIGLLAKQLIEFDGANRDALRRKADDYSMGRATEGLQRALRFVGSGRQRAR